MGSKDMTEGTAGVVFSGAETITADASPSGESCEAFSRQPVLALRSAPAWLDERIGQLRSLLQLQDNWDSYGGRAIDRQSVEIATQLLKALAVVEGVEAPTVTASPDGNAALCWDNGRRSLDLEVMPDGRFEYVFLNEEDPSKDDEGITSSADGFAELLTAW